MLHCIIRNNSIESYNIYDYKGRAATDYVTRKDKSLNNRGIVDTEHNGCKTKHDYSKRCLQQSLGSAYFWNEGSLAGGPPQSF